MKSETLSALVATLNSGGCNYTAFLRSYTVPTEPGATSEQLIRAALGDTAVLGGVGTVELEHVVAEVEASLRYAGDSSAGPDPESVRSEHFAELLASLLADILALSEQASRIEQFWLKKGHPAYPVFWDFAFLFTGLSESTVLVGSSSD